jgi:acyl carrier protein
MAVVRELAGTPASALDAQTPLVEAGIDSLAATELASKLAELTGVSLSAALVYAQRTPRNIAVQLAGAATPPPAPSTRGARLAANIATRRGPTMRHANRAPSREPYDACAPFAVTDSSLPPKPTGGPSGGVGPSGDAHAAATHSHAHGAGVADADIAPLRVLMLHGDAADEALMSKLLQASGWSTTRAHFVCVNAQHSCPPKPHLFGAFADRGMYEKDAYYTWGLHADDAMQPRIRTCSARA